VTLTSRLSAFFLLGLAAVLAGFCITLYLIADDYLEGRERERARAALNALRAMAEADPDGVEWEGGERGAYELSGDVVWTVHDETGTLLDRSTNLPADDPLRSLTGPAEGWLSAGFTGPDRRGVRLAVSRGPAAAGPVATRKHERLTLTAAVSKLPRQALLRRLAAALAGTSAAVLLLALLASRWFCRRALRPVAAMADQARAMDAEAGGERLAVPTTGDELAALGLAFNGLLDRLHEALERQRRFTGDASHQLRTPLAGILGQVEVALRHPRPAEEYRETLEAVRRQADHLRRVVEMLLYLARADAEARLDDLIPLDLAAWLPEHLASWSTHPRARDLHATVDVPGPCLVKAHAPLLGQLLDNLIENACKYSEPGTPVTVRLSAADGTAIIAVEDRGIGIAADDLPHLFAPFYRSAAARTHGRAGVGLGLAIASRIARLFAGTLTASPRPDGGSRFELRLSREP
jgi:two-component system OmpR family sensor kinase